MPSPEQPESKNKKEQPFENLKKASERLAPALDEINPIEALQLAALENDILSEHYEALLYPFEALAGLPSNERLDLLNDLKEADLVSQETYDLLALAIFTLETKAEEKEIAAPPAVTRPLEKEKITIPDLIKKAITLSHEYKSASEVPVQAVQEIKKDMASLWQEDRDLYKKLRTRLGAEILKIAETKDPIAIDRSIFVIDLLLGKFQAVSIGTFARGYHLIHARKNYTIRHPRDSNDRPRDTIYTKRTIRDFLAGWYATDYENITESERRFVETLLDSMDGILAKLLKLPAKEPETDQERERIDEQRKFFERILKEKNERARWRQIMREQLPRLIALEEWLKQEQDGAFFKKYSEEMREGVDAAIKEHKSQLSQELASAPDKSLAEAKDYLKRILYLSFLLDSLEKERSSQQAIEEMPEIELDQEDRIFMVLEQELRELLLIKEETEGRIREFGMTEKLQRLLALTDVKIAAIEETSIFKKKYKQYGKENNQSGNNQP